MPSLPALPVKNAALRDHGANNVLYDKATREYLSRNFPAALTTLSIMRRQQLSPKMKRKSFSLYIAVLDSTSSLPDKELKALFGRESGSMTDKLRSASIWQEAESYFPLVPGDIYINMLLSLTRHMSSPASLQRLVEEYLASLDPDSGLHDSVAEIYTLQVLPRCRDWSAAQEYIESADCSDARRAAWLDALWQVKHAQEQEEINAARHLEQQRAAEQEAKKLRKIRKSRGGTSSSKRSAASVSESFAEAGGGHEQDAQEILGGPLGKETSEPGKTNEAGTVVKRSTAVETWTTWTRSLTMRFSPQLIKTLLFLALLFGATGRREIRERIKTALKKAGSTIAAGFRVSYV